MYKKFGYKLFLLGYQVVRNIRYSLLSSVFGIVVHCKHEPTCGTNMFRQIEKKGFLTGFVVGMKRVLTCW